MKTLQECKTFDDVYELTIKIVGEQDRVYLYTCQLMLGARLSIALKSNETLFTVANELRNLLDDETNFQRDFGAFNEEVLKINYEQLRKWLSENPSE